MYKDENIYQKRIREVIEEQVADIARQKAREQNLPKEMEIILVDSAVKAARESFLEREKDK